MSDWLPLIVAACVALAIIVPLAVKLGQTLRAHAQAGNWDQIIGLVLKLMANAEKQFSSGADKKAWVMSMVVTAAEHIDYELDASALAKIEVLIDEICAASKIVNVHATADPAIAE